MSRTATSGSGFADDPVGVEADRPQLVQRSVEVSRGGLASPVRVGEVPRRVNKQRDRDRLLRSAPSSSGEPAVRYATEESLHGHEPTGWPLRQIQERFAGSLASFLSAGRERRTSL
jgi:hypothetical protein